MSDLSFSICTGFIGMQPYPLCRGCLYPSRDRVGWVQRKTYVLRNQTHVLAGLPGFRTPGLELKNCTSRLFPCMFCSGPAGSSSGKKTKPEAKADRQKRSTNWYIIETRMPRGTSLRGGCGCGSHPVRLLHISKHKGPPKSAPPPHTLYWDGRGWGGFKSSAETRGPPFILLQMLLLSVVKTTAHTLILALNRSFPWEPANSESTVLKDLNCLSGAWYCLAR